MPPANLKALANDYGNIDIRRKVPAGCAYVPGERLGPSCRALGMDYAPAFVGWKGSKRFPRPDLDGVVIAEQDAPRLLAYLEERDKRSAKAAPARAKARAAKAQARLARADELGLLPDSRTFKALLAGEIDEDEARRIGRITRYRHENTDYEDLLKEGYSKDEARALMQPRHAPSCSLDENTLGADRPGTDEAEVSR